MDKIIIPESYNYIAAFLTFDCNLHCSYCINKFDKLNKQRNISGEEWVKFINRIESREDLPITLQGGEPTLHEDFYYIVNNIKTDLNIDVLTNARFRIEEFIQNVNPNRIKRESPYASIRVSYHPEQMVADDLIKKVIILKNKGYHIGIWSVLHPNNEKDILIQQELCRRLGIDFRIKEFLGMYKKKMYGEYKYENAIKSDKNETALCKTTELLISPSGNIHKCHSDLYANLNSIGSIDNFKLNDVYRRCDRYGQCNPCDIKVKTNRLQQYGHTSVDIKRIDNLVY